MGLLHRQPSYRGCRSRNYRATVVAAASLLQLSCGSISAAVFVLLLAQQLLCCCSMWATAHRGIFPLLQQLEAALQLLMSRCFGGLC